MYKFKEFLNLYDSKGFSIEETEISEYFEKWNSMLEGRVEEGKHFKEININAPTKIERKIDVIIFILSYSDDFRIFEKIYEQAKRKDIKCIFAISQIDRTVKNFFPLTFFFQFFFTQKDL